MSIVKNGKKLVAEYSFTGEVKRTVVAIYKGTKLIWQYITSCFAKGFWIDEQPWTDKEGWKD